LLTAQITGGLGNQLFTYARLAVYAHQNGLDLQIDGSIAERVLGRTPDLFDFKLRGELQLLSSSYSSSATQIERMLWRTRLTRTLSKRHQENLLGASNVAKNNLDGWKVRGFFQDYKVAKDFISIFGKDALSLKNESINLEKMSDDIFRKNVVGIHIRRGDYLNYKDSFGLLSHDYYLGAFKTLNEKMSFSEAMIFTDSPEMVGELKSQLNINSRVVSPNDLSTSETMTLMSRCSGLITSNSTFSFWAAIIGDDLKVVIPSPWFKSSDAWLQSAEFMNPDWNKQEAVWL
jgi:hypothetical protein